MKTIEQLAQEGYKAYVKQAGGLTFDGKSIPTWSQIGAERQTCWLACAKEILAQSAALGVLQTETSAVSENLCKRRVKRVEPYITSVSSSSK